MEEFVHNPTIQKKADRKINGKITDLFAANGMFLSENRTTEDYGIDFYFEAFNIKDRYLEYVFCLQNKGTEAGFTVLQEGNLISFPLKIDRCQYYYGHTEPVIMMLCDVQTSKVYWYAIQLDTEILGRMQTQRELGREYIQLYIPLKNELSEATFNSFLEALQKARTKQIHRHQQSITILKSDYATSKKQDGENIVDHLIRVMNLFEGIHVLPPFILAQVYPFRGDSGKTHLYGETLSTNSGEFFDFISNLELKGGKITLKETNVSYADTENLHEKIEQILDFFAYNFITHIEWTGRPVKPRICVHLLFISSRCDCERCNYRRLDLQRTEELLNRESTFSKLEFKLRKAYTHFLMADYYGSYKLHHELLSSLSIEKNPTLYTITKFNIIQIKNIVDGNYLGEGRMEMLNDKTNLNVDEVMMPPYFVDFFRLVKSNGFINNALWRIDTSLTEIQKTWFSDQRGGRSGNQYSRNLIVEFSRAYNFIEYNLIIYNDYREFEVLVEKALEGLFAMYSIVNDGSSRYEKFSIDMLDKWLFHGSPKHMEYLIRKYDIKKLRVNDQAKVYFSLNEYMKNLVLYASTIAQLPEKENYSQSDKIRHIIENFLLIVTVVDLSPSHKNTLISQYLKLTKLLKTWYFTGFEYLGFLLDRYDSLTTTNLKSAIEVLVYHDCFGHIALELAVEKYVLKLRQEEIEPSIKKVLKLKNYDSEMFASDGKLSNLIWLISRLSTETSSTIVKSVMQSLERKFEPSLYYHFSAHNLIPYDESLFKKFVQVCPDLSSGQHGWGLFGQKELKNYFLDMIVDQIFKFEIPITDKLRDLKYKAKEPQYYAWLLDLDGFDYSEFKPYWILNQRNVNYTKAYRGSENLKKALARGLKERYVEGIAKAFMDIYHQVDSPLVQKFT